MLEPGAVLHQLGQPVAVHLGHLDIGDDQRHPAVQVPVVRDGRQGVPELLTIGEHLEVHIVGLPQGVPDHLAEKDGVLRYPDGLVVPVPGPQALHLGNLNRRLRRDLRNDALKVQNGHQVPALALGDAGSHALGAAGNRLIRLLNVRPGNAVDAHHRVNPEGDKHLVEIGDDENILGALLLLHAQIPGQIYHRQHRVPGLEDALHRRVGVGHGLHRLGDHDLPDFGHVDAEQIPPDGKLHDLNLIGTGLQQDPAVLRFSHSLTLPSLINYVPVLSQKNTSCRP